MKVDEGDPRWAAVLGTYTSALPPASVSAGKMVPLLAQLSHEGCVAACIRDGAQLGARIGRVVASTAGWPEPRIAKLDLLARSASAIVPESQVAQALAAGVTFGATKIVGAALSELDAALSGITGIPILGWIVGIGRAVWQIVAAAKERAPQVADQQALAYERDADSSAAQHILDLAANADWTRIFLPPDGAWQRERLAYTTSGLADGDVWGQLSGLDPGGIGAVPGIAELAGYWQSPRNMPGSSRWADRLSIQSAATLLPSTTTLCGQLWCAAQAGGLATTGRIDFNRVADAWRDYTGELQQFAGATRGGGDPTQPQASERHGWLADQIVRAWSWDIAHQAPYYGLVRAKVPAKYRIGLLDKIIEWRCAQAKTATIKAWRMTCAAAYVDEDAPALADTMLRHAWKSNRRLMLQQPSRRVGLDLDLVPKGDYRNELATKPIPKGPGTSTGGAYLIGTFNAPTGSGGSSSSGEGGGGAAILAAAAAALLALS